MRLFTQLHARLGDLWWYTSLLFVVQRFGDIINMFVGMWLVPRYVPQAELGAVLPLTQFVSLVGLPLGVIAIPFMKYLNLYAEKGEYGKVKSLLRDAFVWTGGLAVVTFLIACYLLPVLFARVRVPVGSLGMLIVAVSILGAVSVIFQNAVQGLKLYSATVWFNALVAPVRLVLMLVFMPFRALSGYFVGQGAAPGVMVLGALWVLRKRLGRSVKAQPYWREDGRAMIRYAIPIAALTIVSVAFSFVDSLIIRHRLSDFESAGYYIISRFSEITSYFGMVFMVFLFPMVASRVANAKDPKDILVKTLYGSTLSGLLFAFFLFFAGSFILGLQDIWNAYQPLVPHMVWLCILNVFLMLNAAFSTYESARGRFRFLWYVIPITVVKGVSLYLLTGYTFFAGILPPGVIRAIDEFNPNRLSFLLAVFIVAQALICACFFMDVFVACKKMWPINKSTQFRTGEV